MKPTVVLFAVTVFGLIQSGCVTSSPEASSFPNPALSATYGEADLSRGGTTTISLVAGGEFDSSDISSACRGMIYDRPDYVFNVTTSGTDALLIAAASDSDTTVVVYGPDNRWYCDDDSAGGLNPIVTIGRAMAGRYAVWVGTHNGGYANAVLGASLATPSSAGAGTGGGTPTFIN